MTLRNCPININKDNWYYEEEKAVCFVHQVYIGGEYIQTDQINISWKKLLESVKRKYNLKG